MFRQCTYNCQEIHNQVLSAATLSSNPTMPQATPLKMRKADFTCNLLHSALASMIRTGSDNRCRTVSLMRKQKIFVIGFHKTGTSSLGAALEILGYTVCDAVGIQDIENETDA